jgi:NRAMP (natural resistance-associated macrophage protein)-like metal ion transporter
MVERAAVPRRTAPRDDDDSFGGLRRIWRKMGPGITTGAADDDPAGIATYSLAGAQFGTALLWTALLTWPLMASVQSMCARIGMVTGRGLMGTLTQKIPRPLLFVIAVALFAANTINVGADLAGMSDAAAILTGFGSRLWVFGFGVAIAVATIRLRYVAIARILKWLAFVLLAYVVDAVVVGVEWKTVLHDTLLPSVPHGREMWATLVAILGTTISPYLFFWQAAQEVEEEKAKGRRRVDDRKGATRSEIRTRKADVAIGTFFSNIVMFFIILATALTLHKHGITHPQSSREVASALTPIAGKFASLLYTIGIVGTGALAIPTLAGSAAYAFAEVFGWREGMDEPYRRARAFYSAFAVSIGLGALLVFLNVNPVRALFLSSVLNGLLAPFLLVCILFVATDKKIMEGQPSSRLGKITVGITTIAMFGAGIAMVVL